MGTKVFKSYEQQVALLESRGMDIDRDDAADVLSQVNYYRLSGYSFPFRKTVKTPNGPTKSSNFLPGTTFSRVLELYDFDKTLRTTVFDALAPIEVSLRTCLGHELGKIDPEAHLKPDVLGAVAQKRVKGRAVRGSARYDSWLARYQVSVDESREEFVQHHRDCYDGVLPIWAAVEVLDWGSLSRLYGLSPRDVQESVAGDLGLTGPQLTTWLRSLNIVRNICAHHGRLFNRNIAVSRVKLPPPGKHPDLDAAGPYDARLFGNLSLIQYLRVRQGHGVSRPMTAWMKSFKPCGVVQWESLGVSDASAIGSIALWQL